MPAFQPPWWLRGGHAQTLAGAFWTGRLSPHRAAARRVRLGDGDEVVVHDDAPPGWQSSGGAVLLMHGLGGSYRSPLQVRLVDKLTARGVRVFRLDMRGCGAGAGLARRPFHAGRSDDVAVVVDSVLEWCRTSESNGAKVERVQPSLALVGVSLSGNTLLKYLGEDPRRVPAAVVAGIAINPPIDLAQSVASLVAPGNRMYDRHFVKALKRQLAERRRDLPDAPMPAGLANSRRLYDFDDWYTGPVSGFTGANDYYARSSAAQFIPDIRVPTTIIASRDDPVVPIDMFETRHGDWPGTVRLEIAAGGGHLGYIARRGLDADVYWLDWRVVELVTTGRILR